MRANPRCSLRHTWIEARPVVYLTDANLAYAEHYDAAEAHLCPAEGVQAIFDSHNARGESLVLVIHAGPVACAVADPGPLYGLNDTLPCRRTKNRRAS